MEWKQKKANYCLRWVNCVALMSLFKRLNAIMQPGQTEADAAATLISFSKVHCSRLAVSSFWGFQCSSGQKPLVFGPDCTSYCTYCLCRCGWSSLAPSNTSNWEKFSAGAPQEIVRCEQRSHNRGRLGGGDRQMVRVVPVYSGEHMQV